MNSNLKEALKILGLIVSIFFVLIGALLGKAAGKALSGQSNEFEKITRETNAKLPMMVDGQTRADKFHIDHKQRKAQYDMTLVNISLFDLRSDERATLSRQLNTDLKQQNLPVVCALSLIKKFGFEVTYQFYGKDGLPLGYYTVAPKECGR